MSVHPLKCRILDLLLSLNVLPHLANTAEKLEPLKPKAGFMPAVHFRETINSYLLFKWLW